MHLSLQWRYTFENMCKEDNDIFLEDGTAKIFFNTDGTEGNISEDTKNILKFIANNTAVYLVFLIFSF